MNKCKNCNKLTENPSYCSKSCSATHTNKTHPKRKTKKRCIICNEIVKSYRHLRCIKHQEEYLETRYNFIKELSLDHYWSKKSLQHLHTSSKSAHIRALARSWFKHLTILPCANCGYNKHVELCHIKPITKFNNNSKLKEINSKENLIQLCRNCHWEFDNGHLLLDFPDQAKCK